MKKSYLVGMAVLASLAAPPLKSEPVRGVLLAQQRLGAKDADVDAILSKHGAKTKKKIKELNVRVIELPEAVLEKRKADLEASGAFTYVERDHQAEGAILPSDSALASQWYISKIDAPSAWNLTTGSPTVQVAVVDSGVDSTHPDLAGKVNAGWSFLLGNNNTADVRGHGTAVAGTIGAATDNAAGIAGVAWNVKIMPLVVLDSTNYASYSNIAAAITWAADRGARVISISIMGTAASSTLQSAVDYAWSKNALVIAAAGNNNASTPGYPAACNRVVAVGATTSTDTKASFSNYGSWIDVVAPGASIYTTNRGGGYGSWNGTSFSTPITAAVAALVVSLRPAISVSELSNLLTSNALDLGAAGFDSTFGWGRVDAYRTVSSASTLAAGDTTAPVAGISTPASGATVTGTVTVQASATDNVAVTLTELYINSAKVATSSSGVLSYSWNTTTSPNGSVALMVKSYDAAGNVGQTTRSVTVSNAVVSDTTAPVATVKNPGNGSKVAGTTKVSGAATDNVAVTQTVIYLDNVQVASCAAALCEYNWNTRKASAGTHTIKVNAWDNNGNMGSASVSVVK